ncbi:MAG: hypothetical protein A3F13_00890 [Gammaproteobacteria bacterium RIFCSPHIGHO2_12_FULL_40_19]|nr:MAG: hypothetical protein A3F13_00890 [Gammaproteobacteria bacterium RIFCSPHIGHO2_12_FULL_40_19]
MGLDTTTLTKQVVKDLKGKLVKEPKLKPSTDKTTSKSAFFQKLEIDGSTAPFTSRSNSPH